MHKNGKAVPRRTVHLLEDLESGKLSRGRVAVPFEYHYWEWLGEYVDDPCEFYIFIDRLAYHLAEKAPDKPLFLSGIHPDAEEQYRLAVDYFDYQPIFNSGWRDPLADYIWRYTGDYLILTGSVGHFTNRVEDALVEVCSAGVTPVYVTHSKLLLYELNEERDSAVWRLYGIICRFGYLALFNRDSHSLAELIAQRSAGVS